FRSGKLGVMEYYNMQNIQADTGMRKAIAEGSSPDMSAMGGSSTTSNA
ncbi:MAG TPA: flotillin-like FloA family protein, partial [Candidatus Kapabacteria bacterium]